MKWRRLLRRSAAFFWGLAIAGTALKCLANGEMAAMGKERLSYGSVAPWALAGVSREAYESFEFFWKSFEAEPHGGNFAIPRKVIWLNGAPGAGKGTNTHYAQDVFQIKAEPIVTSDLLDSPDFQKEKDAGQLIGDREVTAIVFRTLLSRPYADGALVDGYPRTAVQAECVKLLHDKIVAMKQTSDFHLVLLEISEEMSVDRQLGRGARAERNNAQVRATGRGREVPIRPTDTDPEAARHRYQVYVEQTAAAVDVLKKYFPCHRVNAEGSFDRVRANVYAIGRPKK